MNTRLIAIISGLVALSNGIAQVTINWDQPTRGLSIAVDQGNNVFTIYPIGDLRG